MPFKIVRNDITKMATQAIVNTANELPVVGSGCDTAVYMAAGYEELLAYRREHIGTVPEGEAFLTPGFALPAEYIIHAVSPLYRDGGQGEEEKLRACYRSSLAIAEEHGITSISFPLISTGSYGYPKEEGMRIAIDEIHSYLLKHDVMIYLVVFGDDATQMGRHIDPKLEAYIDRRYVSKRLDEEYAAPYYGGPDLSQALPSAGKPAGKQRPSSLRQEYLREERPDDYVKMTQQPFAGSGGAEDIPCESMSYEEEDEAYEELERKIRERMEHMSDSFSRYLLFLIGQKGLKNADVYKSAIVDKKVFSKLKTNPEYHPDKSTALRLCVGARLNMDETKDLLGRAGYALSPCDKTDIIFSYFIENGIYNMIEIDIQLEEHGLPCIIT